MSSDTQHDTATAQRFKKPTWRDPRLVVGLLLVLTSIVAVVLLISALNRTEPYYVAAHDLSVGQRVTDDDLVPVDVRLQDASQQYVSAETDLKDNDVLVQRVPKGQLVPTNAVGTADELDRSPVGIALETPLPAEARAGSRVDVWVADQKASGRGYEKPRKLIPGAEISKIETTNSALGSSTGTTVHVLATQAQVEPLVDALGNSAKVTLVLNPTGDES